MNIFLAVLFLLAAGYLAVLLNVFRRYDQKKLRQMSAAGDDHARRLYEVARFRRQGLFCIEFALVFFVAIALFFVFAAFDGLLLYLSALVILLTLFIYLPSSKPGKKSIKLAAKYSAELSKILQIISPVVALTMPKAYFEKAEVIIFDKDELTDLLQKQKQYSNIDQESLDRTINSLRHEQKKVKNVMVKMDKMRVLRPNETVGPILLSELHKSGQKAFAVIKNSQVEGIVRLNDLIELKKGGKASDVIKHEVVYVNSEWTLIRAMEAYRASGVTDFLVVDPAENVVGLASLDDLTRSKNHNLPQPDQLDYADKAAVAAA